MVCLDCVQGHFLRNNTCHTCASYWPGCVDCLYSHDTENEKNKYTPSYNNLDLNGFGSNWRDLQVVSNDLDGDGYAGGKLGQDVVSRQVIDPRTQQSSVVTFGVSMCLKAAHGFYFDQ